MNEWPLQWISEQELTEHVSETIKKYEGKLESFNVKKFNQNIIDPVKLMFDKNVYGEEWDEIIKNEIYRQRDKSNTNDIGYFHQHIFQYVKNCEVPLTGWDVIYTPDEPVTLADGNNVTKIYVEIKNKHNTMNSSSARATYMKMQNQILTDDSCACYLMEIIAKRSQDIKWGTTIDRKSISHKSIRRVSADKFYELVTGDADAFFNLCKVLPAVVAKVVHDSDEVKVPNDTVYDEIRQSASERDITFGMALFLLGFSSYQGFDDIKS